MRYGLLAIFIIVAIVTFLVGRAVLRGHPSERRSDDASPPETPPARVPDRSDRVATGIDGTETWVDIDGAKAREAARRRDD